jgi:ATP-binding protein involved in chromosome partitioning
MAVTPELVLEKLAKIQEPSLRKNLVEADLVHQIEIQGSEVSFHLRLPAASAKFQGSIEATCERELLELEGVEKVRIQVSGATGLSNNPIPMVRNTIAVAAGKGGVGKSTVSCNLAVGLAKKGYQVGLMDIDIFGPSIPMMMGVSSHPEVENQKLLPPVAFGVKLMSIGFLIDENKPVIWRGPMVNGAIQQFFRDVAWGTLDYLIIDLPPGTGDAQLTLVQTISLTGAVIVCTPQDVALLDARKALNMFRETHVYILGMVENMSYFRCGNCSEIHHIFGSGGVERTAGTLKVPYLGGLPLIPGITNGGDTGNPFLATADQEEAKPFLAVVDAVVAQVEKKNDSQGPTLVGISAS